MPLSPPTASLLQRIVEGHRQSRERVLDETPAESEVHRLRSTLQLLSAALDVAALRLDQAGRVRDADEARAAAKAAIARVRCAG